MRRDFNAINNLMQAIIHYFLHLGFPLIIALLFFKKEWKKVYFILIATMLVDVDHLLATPIFQANRCSIGYHYLHSYPAIIAYVGMLFLKKPYHIIGIGLLLHMVTDFIDCLFMYNHCDECAIQPTLQPILQSIKELVN